MEGLKIKLIIFDLCGVLIDVAWEDMDEILKRNNVKVERETFKKISGEVFTLKTHKSNKDAVETFLMKIGEGNNDKLRQYQINFLDEWGKLARPNSYGKLMLEIAREVGLKTAVLSNVFPVKEQWLREWGIDAIDKFFFSYETGIAKPEKKAFKNVMSHFSVSPRETLLVGNSMNKDIIPADELGIRTIYLDPHIYS